MFSRRRVFSAWGVLGCAAVLNCGGGNSPSSPSSTPGTTPQPVCRDYASKYSSVSSDTPSGGSSTLSATCSFSASDSTLTCDVIYRNGGTYPGVRTDRYASVGDFVDEAGFVGRTLVATSTLRVEDSDGEFVDLVTNQYDAQRRLTGYINTVNGRQHGSATYTSWDSRGRPTAGTMSDADTGTGAVQFSYDDGARTVTASAAIPGYAVSTATTYNEFNLPVRVSITTPYYQRTTTTTVEATVRVCK